MAKRKQIDPNKHPFSAALYNTPPKGRGKKVPHEWGGDGKEEYVGKHRKGCAVVALILLGMSGGIGAAVIEWLA